MNDDPWLTLTHFTTSSDLSDRLLSGNTAKRALFYCYCAL